MNYCVNCIHFRAALNQPERRYQLSLGKCVGQKTGTAHLVSPELHEVIFAEIARSSDVWCGKAGKHFVAIEKQEVAA